MRWVRLLPWVFGVWALAGEVVKLSLDGTVNPATSAYIVRGLGEAARIGATLVILELDTPGGLDTP